MGLPPPQFREMGGEFIVTFRNTPVSDTGPVGTTPSREDGVQQLMLDILPASAASEIPDKEELSLAEQRMVTALRYIQEHGAITNHEYCELTGVSESTALRDLEAWVARGTLKKVGKRRGRRYELSRDVFIDYQQPM